MSYMTGLLVTWVYDTTVLQSGLDLCFDWDKNKVGGSLFTS